MILADPPSLQLLATAWAACLLANWSRSRLQRKSNTLLSVPLQDGRAWYDAANRGPLNKAVLGAAHRALSVGRDHFREGCASDAASFDELKKELDPLIDGLAEFTMGVGRLTGNSESGLQHLVTDVAGLSNLVCSSMRLAIKDKNPKLLGVLLKTALLLVDQRQHSKTKRYKLKKTIVESGLLEMCVDACLFKDGPPESGHGETSEATVTASNAGLEEREQSTTTVCLGPGLRCLFSYISKLLLEILPATSGFSQQAIEFLRSKCLFVPYDGFDLQHLKRADNVFKVTKSSTTISADSVVCAVASTEAMGRSFDHVWMPLSVYRLILHPLNERINQNEHDKPTGIGRALFSMLMMLAAILTFASALVGIAVYPLLLIYVYIVHGLNMYSAADTGSKQITGASSREETAEQDQEASPQAGAMRPQASLSGESSGGSAPTKSVPGNTSCSPCSTDCMWAGLQAFLYRPLDSFFGSLKGNQSVAGHVLCLPGVGSLRSLKTLLTAPIDAFEAPAVRAAVEGAWSRFVIGFYVRFALFAVQLLLFSAFASWCIARGIPYSAIMDASQDVAVRASFIGGCVAAGIGAYFLMREVLQCCACVADEGLKDYFEFWSVVQVCSHSLELASLAMFVLENDSVETRIVTTYAVFSLWINLLYFTKAIRQISFLLEILTTIISDMIPFVLIMMILVLAVTFALLVLVGNMEDHDIDDQDVRFFASFGTPLDLVIRMKRRT